MIDDKVWEKYLKDQSMTEIDRLEEIRKRAMLIEQRAQMDEKLIRNAGDANATVDRSIAINDMYLEAIQAKLKILDHI